MEAKKETIATKEKIYFIDYENFIIETSSNDEIQKLLRKTEYLKLKISHTSEAKQKARFYARVKKINWLHKKEIKS